MNNRGDVIWLGKSKVIFTDKKQHEKKWTVYIHISPSNKYYVGITSREPELRWKNGKGYQ